MYEYPDSPAIAWDYLEAGTNADDIYFGWVRYNGVLWLVYRGSVTKTDWAHDLYTFYNPCISDALGPVHPGFYSGLQATVQKFLNARKPGEPIGITGHSLAAGRGSLATGLCCVANARPDYRIVFGEPHSASSELSGIIRPVATSLSYRNTGGSNSTWEDVDEITRVPPWFDVPTERLDMTVTPDPDDPWGAFRFHHMGLYAGAVGTQKTWSR